MPEPPGKTPELPPTASGLDESQIDPADLVALRGAVRLNHCELGTNATVRQLRIIEPGFSRGELHNVELGFTSPRALALRLAPLPKQAKLRRLAWPEPRTVLKHDVRLAQQQPVRRNRLHADELPPAKLKALLAAMYKKYGPEAGELEIAAVFAHIPPEAKDTIGLDPALHWATFTLPAGTVPVSAHADFYLAVLHTKSSETRKVLFRL